MSEDLIIVQNLIYEIRGQKVMLDFDLAKLYQVETKVLNQAVKRNASAPPFAFTERGVAMLATVLKSPIAVAASISIMRAFVQVRQYLLTTASMSAELKELRAKVDLIALQREEDLREVNDLSEDVRQDIDNLYLAIGELSSRIEEKKQAPRRKIGFQQNMED